MDALYRGQWEHTTEVTESARRQASGLTAAHLQWHLERQLRTLPLIEREAPHRGLTSVVTTATARKDIGDPATTQRGAAG
jgi:DNA repair protein RecO (recombination protein O)